MRKIRILHHWVPEYRVALYEGLGKRYAGEIEILASREGVVEPYILKNVKVDYGHPFKRLGPLKWQVGMTLKGLQKKRDIVVINGDIRELSSVWAAVKAKMRGIKVLWWAQHKGSSSTELSTAVRLWISKLLADVFLCYTRTGINYLVSKGFDRERVFATGNTIDLVPIKTALDYWSQDRLAEFRCSNGLGDKDIFLCCGYMRTKVHLDLFIKAMAVAPLQNVSLVVIGDGMMKNNYIALSKDIGVADRITWLPATHNQLELAPWFLTAKAFVYPGGIGLSILHSFSYGLPVIVHNNVDHQMPEFEVMEDGKTGYTFKEDDVDDLVRVSQLILSDNEKRKKMAEYAQKIAFEKYTMAQMIDNFSSAIDKTFSLYK